MTTVCAFANSKGGVVYVGVRREESDPLDGKITYAFLEDGVSLHSASEITDGVHGRFQDNAPVIKVETAERLLGSRVILAVTVSPNRSGVVSVLQGGKAFRRSGAHNEPIPTTGVAIDTFAGSPESGFRPIASSRADVPRASDAEPGISEEPQLEVSRGAAIASSFNAADTLKNAWVLKPPSIGVEPAPVSPSASTDGADSHTAGVETSGPSSSTSDEKSSDEDPARRATLDGETSPTTVAEGGDGRHDLNDEMKVETLRPSFEDPDGDVNGRERVPEEVTARPVGGRSLYRRNPQDGTVALNAQEYADVVADVLHESDDREKLTMAIFGHWGRGKTFLADKIAENLGGRSQSGKRYQVVKFSAWRYRTTPEIWAYLFEEMKRAAERTSWAIPWRALVLRRGWWSLCFAIWSLAFALLPMQQKLSWAYDVMRIVGVGCTLYFGAVACHFFRAGVRLWQLRTAFTHSDALGLQATVGDDLQALMKSWVSRHAATKAKEESAGKQATLWGRINGKLDRVWRRYGDLCPRLLAGIGVLMVLWVVVALPRDSWTWTAFAIQGAIGACWLGFAFVAGKGLLAATGTVDRVLLVIDDLDRCEPCIMLEIIESLLLILDCDEISRRLQILMLIDEDSFGHAVLTKYRREQASSTSDGQTKDAREALDRQIVRENREKFFLVHLRLAPLNGDEIAQVVQRFVDELAGGSEHDSGGAVPPPAKAETDASGSGLQSVTAGAVGSLKPEVKSQPVRGPDGPKILEESEKRVLRERISGRLAEVHDDRIGPRAIRCILFRYELARSIMQKRQVSFEPDALVDEVVDAYLDPSKASGDAVRMVS